MNGLRRTPWYDRDPWHGRIIGGIFFAALIFYIVGVLLGAAVLPALLDLAA